MDLNIKTNLFNKTRQRSIKIIENLSPEDMNIQSMEDASPIKWHLAHTTWFFEKFLLLPHFNNYKSFDKSFDYIFNSYYLGVGEFNEKSKRGFLNRPLLKDVLEYRKHVDLFIEEFLTLNSSEDLKFIFELE